MKILKTILLIMSFLLGSCSPKKPSLFEEFKKGNQLQLAQEISVAQFFQIWMRRDIPWKANVEITEVYTDNLYVYFYERLHLKNTMYLGNRNFESGIEKLFKVNKEELASEFYFYKEFIPSDLRRFFLKKMELKNKMISNENKIFSYALKAEKIIITLDFNGEKEQLIYDAKTKQYK